MAEKERVCDGRSSLHFVLFFFEINRDIRTCGGGMNGNPSICMVNTMQGLLEGNVSGVVSGAYTADQRVIQFAAAAFNTPQVAGAASTPLPMPLHFILSSLRLL